MDHHLSQSFLSSSATPAATPFVASGKAAMQNFKGVTSSRQIDAGKAIRLQARQLSVLRVTHGRLWVTLTDVGPYSRVIAGDHFLSRGESLTLLPGQSLVMEPFGIGHASPAQFVWETPGVVVPQQAESRSSSQAAVLEPLRDLRHALGLGAGASGRLVRGLALGAVALAETLLAGVAMIFVAARADESCTAGTFDAKKSGPAVSGVVSAGCRAV